MANAYTIKATPGSTDSITISDVTGAIFRATLGSLPWTSSAIGALSGFDSNGVVGCFDNAIISTDPNRDLYALALLEAYPG